jgi:hypothetical protein
VSVSTHGQILGVRLFKTQSIDEYPHVENIRNNIMKSKACPYVQAVLAGIAADKAHFVTMHAL